MTFAAGFLPSLASAWQPQAAASQEVPAASFLRGATYTKYLTLPKNGYM